MIRHVRLVTLTFLLGAMPGALAFAASPTSGVMGGITADSPVNGAFETETHPASAFPLRIEDLQEIPGGRPLDETVGPPLDIRKDALKEAALSLGARGALAYRSYEIRQELRQYESYLDKVFDFRQLLIAAPSGLLIEPPIVSESDDALIIDPQGLKAAVADRIYEISKNAKIVTSPRNWRAYLERSWGSVDMPPDILRPKTKEERAEWRENVKIGWKQGYSQADETFTNDVQRLIAEFNGMVRYRKLLAQGMISSPFALQTDRGVTGGGKDDKGRAQAMRIGDRAIQITGVPELVPGAAQWQPANQ